MNVTAPATATLIQALMGPDTAAPADPAAPVPGGDFAMMMAGVTPPPVAPAEDTAADGDVTKAAARDRDDRDDGDGEAPDAVLLAMLAITPPPAPAATPSSAAADVQAPATISTAARAIAGDAVMPPGTAAGPADNDPAAAPAPDAEQKAAIPADPAGLPAPPIASADAGPNPGKLLATTAAIRKAIAGMLGLKQPAPAIAADVAATAGPAISAEAQGRHAPGDATATTDDDGSDADTPALAVAPPGIAPATIAPGVPTTPAGEASSAHRHPAADVSAQLGEHHIALAQGDGWLDQLARDISATAAPDGKLNFRLNPERLGSLHVEVARGAEGAAVRLTADSSATRDILLDAQPQLAAQAQAQGVRIAGTHVDLGAGASGGQGGGRQEHVPAPQVRALVAAVVAPTTEPAGPRVAASERYA